MVSVVRDKDIRGFDETPYAVGLVSTILWVAYGIVTPNRTAALATNLIGFAFEVRGVALS